MDRAPASRLERILADFAEQHGVLARVREQMRALSVTARSRDDVVEVTVDAEGRAAGIRFVHQRFREMTASQLGDSVMEALTTARAEVSARATATITAAGLPLSASVESVRREEPVAYEPDAEATSGCLRRLVREAHAVTVDPCPAPEPHIVSAGAYGAGPRESAAPVLREVTRSRPQGPLWGRSRPTGHTALPAELREAVLALKNAVCIAVGGYCAPSACGYVAALEYRGGAAAAQSA
jgi:DNA-binding protein YbaB